MGDDGTCIQKDEPFLMVIKENQIADISLMGDKDKVTGYITPVIDVKVGTSVDFDIQKNEIYWVEVEKEGDTNGTLYKTSLGGGEKASQIRPFFNIQVWRALLKRNIFPHLSFSSPSAGRI